MWKGLWKLIAIRKRWTHVGLVPVSRSGACCSPKGKPAEARGVLDGELKLAPSDPKACYYAGLAAVQLGEMSKAAPLLEIADRWTTYDPEPAMALAQVYLALGKRDEAAAAARRAQTLSPASNAARELLQVIQQAK